MECLYGRQVMWLCEMRGFGRFHRPAAILQAHSLIAEQQAQGSAVVDIVGGGDKCACFRGDGDAACISGDQIIMFAETTRIARGCDDVRVSGGGFGRRWLVCAHE